MDKKKVEEAVYNLLEALGENPDRDGLIDTPKRVANMYEELLEAPDLKYTTFEETNYKDIVLLKDIEFNSMCEHHLLPFYGKIHIAYIPNGKIIGISKLARIVEKYAKRLQVQERMTEQIVKDIQENLETENVAVYIEAKHMCMIVRGVKKVNAKTVTAKFTGIFNESEKKNEFYSLIK
ncbi:MAG: GTP cyclohydrolase I FolE [Clostridia bacterium]|nr:GTP cyclohydrolase I FolE [Clostridia bacterium]